MEESAASVCIAAGREVPANGFNFGELRQRPVNGGSSEDLAASAAAVVDGGGKDDGGANASPVEKEKPTNEPDRSGVAKLEKVESLDWRRLMAEDPNCEWNCSLLCMHRCISLFLLRIDDRNGIYNLKETKMMKILFS